MLIGGQQISHYWILEKLGEGGMGAVYRAEDLLLGRPVALKFLHKSEDAERLLREAKAACAVTHPNVCLVYEVDPAHGFIAMEFVDGVTLDKQWGGRPLPAEEAIDLALQLCEGLRAAHEVRVIHRDLKSANVMVSRIRAAGVCASMPRRGTIAPTANETADARAA